MTTTSLDNAVNEDQAMTAPCPQAARRRVSPVKIALLASLTFVAIFGAYHRIGTTANADVVELTKNLGGGFLALGMTDDQPGFLVLSALDAEHVQVHANQFSTAVGGTHTSLIVETNKESLSKRMRGPVVALVSDDGSLQTISVPWSLEKFVAIRRGVDCSGLGPKKVKRCGAPFADLLDIVNKWPGNTVPRPVAAFLESHVPAEARTFHRHAGHNEGSESSP